MSNEHVVMLNSDNYELEVLNASIPVVVDFYADWCGPCQTLGPIMDELADEYQGKVKVCKVNVDGQRDLARKFKVMSIPTVLIYKNGEQKNRVNGAYSKNEFKKMIDETL
ncbi:thioredoxin 1 [Anaerosolibacter carboniphilus]|uniref:Thioredoxin n=1 Tax=Anaerosolibacter carboniphilus TaxID=1417629 RepID=A0A841KN05_9FIRM|nr:thioredoxin [Anaerosolibacter carboniphilus]MBB6214827.1 thioredoxin 1 [Anaerosolibacter carboniphilus]